MSSVFDPGKGDREAASRLGQQGIIEGFDFSGPGGLGGSFNFEGGQSSSQTSLGSFEPLMQMLQQLGMSGASQAEGGLPPELMALGGQTNERLGQMDVSQLTNESNFAGLGDIFQSALGTAQADPFDLGEDISGRLRQLSARRNRRDVSSMFDRLQSAGTRTSSSGLIEADLKQQRLFEQGLQFDLTGLEAGRGMQGDAMSRLMAAMGGREQIGARQFGESFGMEQLGGQRALQQFGVGSNLFDSFLQNRQQGAGLALAGTQGAAGLSQLPLVFMQALQGMTTGASNSLFGAAGIEQQNAAMAQSPFLEALNAAGQFMGQIKPEGI
ncbi:hypothetical protein LCGC14_1837820 [marine sediment metagenome]|uniref:Uncharacterized protein n=1 Tax=marine sediment metagenome TaxID=412755 RepID=A0A0F9H2A0_9ZZZZ